MKYRYAIALTALLLFIVPVLAGVAAVNKVSNTNNVSAITKTMDAYGRQPDAAATDTPGGIGTFIETILVLLLFVLGVYGVFRFIQKKRGALFDDSEAIMILASNSLGNNRALQIVRVGTRAFLIGVADNGVNLISEITEKELIDRLSLVRDRSGKGGSQGFVERLFHVLGKEQPNASTQKSEADLQFLKAQRDRLQNLKKE